MNKKHFYPIVILLLFLAAGIQTTRAAITLSEGGWSDPTVGTWDPDTRTATLTTDVTQTIIILNPFEDDPITLLGGGHKISGVEGHGVDLGGSCHVTIKNLNVTGFVAGITLNPSGYCKVIDCSISNSYGPGIFMTTAGTCTLEGNTISGCDWGILIQSGSVYNTLKNNNIENNNVGICITDTSNTNTIYNNNFIDNGIQADVYQYDNYFDFGGSGNYWSDWCPPEHPDADGDGIVDEPYVIVPPDFLQDNFPLAPTPEQALGKLIVKVEDVNGEYGISNALDSKLENALAALEAKNAGLRQDAINKMEAFINAVEAQRDNKVPGDVADDLIADANYIISLL